MISNCLLGYVLSFNALERPSQLEHVTKGCRKKNWIFNDLEILVLLIYVLDLHIVAPLALENGQSTTLKAGFEKVKFSSDPFLHQ